MKFGVFASSWPIRHLSQTEMDWSIHVSKAREVRSKLTLDHIIAADAGSKLAPVVDLTLRLVEEYFGRVSFSRCVYGNEFCEHLIPTREQLKAVVRIARVCEMPLALVTPYVSDGGIEALRPLFELLSEAGDECEVVFNDWGVLNVLREGFPELIPVQGRLMNKSLRDPRVTGVYASSEAPGRALVSLRSAYIPFGFISTSRICMAAGIHYDKRDKFQPGAPCHHECQTHLLEYGYTNTPFDNRDQKFYLKGNTYFYVHTEAMLRTLFEQARAGLIDRIVFQPQLPMMWERP